MELILRNGFRCIKNHFSEYAKYYVIFLSITFVFIAIEIRHPFHFLQDDVRGYFLPAAVHNYKSLMEDGEIALYNFHQFRGIAAHACMEPAALYPFTYISVFLSSLFSGNFFLTAEFLVYIHLIIAGIGFFKFLKVMRFNDLISILGAVTWPLTSFVIFVSNSWVHVSSTAAYFPWILFFSISFYRTLELKYLAGAIAARIFLLFSGHPEYFIYSMIFEGLTVVLLFIPEAVHAIRAKKTPAPLLYVMKRILLVLTGYILTFALSLPFVLPGLKQISMSAERGGVITFEYFIADTIRVIDFFTGLLNPSQLKTGREYNWAHMYNLSFIGYIPLIFFFVTLIEIIRKRIKREKIKVSEIQVYMLFILGLTAFLWTTDKNIFARILYQIPFINMTYYHFKIIIFTNFFLITISMYGVHLISKALKNMAPINKTFHHVLSVCILIQVATFAGLYLYLPHMAFGFHLDKLPYDEPLKDRLTDGRFMSGGFQIYGIDPLNAYSTNTYSFPPIAFNYATLWDMYTVAGYETLVRDLISSRLIHHGIYQNSLRMPVSFLRKWGVKYYIIKNDSPLINPSAKEIYKDEARTVYLDPEAKPLFFFEKPENKNIYIDYKIRTNSIELSFDSASDDILTINFLFHPFFRADVDDASAAVEKNMDKQVVLSVPAGKHAVVLRYKDPNFILGINVAFLTFCVCLLFLLIRYILKVKGILPVNLPGITLNRTQADPAKAILPRHPDEGSYQKIRNKK